MSRGLFRTLADSLIQLIDRKVDAGSPELPLFDAAVVAEAIDRGFEPVLGPAGFVRTSPRVWVRSAKPLIREIVTYSARKGASYTPAWGVSLDFVPVWKASGLRWKRTAKSAEPDIPLERLAPFDDRRDLDASLLGLGMVGEPLAEMEARATRAAVIALASLDTIDGVPDVVTSYETLARQRLRGLGLDNYVQVHIGWGLTLLALGDEAGGREHLARFCEIMKVDPADAFLARAAEAARALAGTA